MIMIPVSDPWPILIHILSREVTVKYAPNLEVILATEIIPYHSKGGGVSSAFVIACLRMPCAQAAL